MTFLLQKSIEPATKKTALDILLGEEETNTTSITSVEDELDSFFIEKVLPCSTKPLTWWKESSTKYSNLALVVQRQLNVPATSTCTPAERVFSKAGLIIVSKHQSSLKQSTANTLIPLNKNLEAFNNKLI